MRIANSSMLSKSILVRAGVWQGNSLSSLLFNICIEPLLLLLESKGITCQAHADDTALALRNC